MTRATLLRLLAHPTALNGADVRALEELAEAFPYCQTAHLLLAKAAHDHGSMLAGQRLRRAATYATDRALLRQLVETTPAEQALEPAATEASGAGSASIADTFAGPAPTPLAEASPTEPPYSRLLTDQPAQEIGPAPQPEAAEPPPASEPAAATAEQLPPATPEILATNSPAPSPTAVTEPVSEDVSAAEDPIAVDLAAEATEARATVDDGAKPQLEVPATEALTADEAETTPPEAPDDAPADPAEPTATADAAVAPTLADAGAQEAVDPTPPAPEVAALSDELPAAASPIRLPAEAEVARQEFGLATAEPTEITAYQLPELELDITVPLAPSVATPRLPAFSGVPDVAYALSEGSRAGFGLVAVAEGSELLMPAASLPPAGEFFLPDALLLAHLAAPPELPTSTTTDLINSFLQRKTGGARRRAAPLAASPQDDLSVRSTRTAPDLASESLARILAKQGKTEQAIAVYERLIVKMPEKSSIFAAEIEALRPSA